MKSNQLIKCNPSYELLTITGFMGLCWIFNFIADHFRGSLWFYLFYQGFFAFGICMLLPVWNQIIKKGRSGDSIGLGFRHWKKAVLIGVIISFLLTAGRLFGMEIIDTNMDHIAWIVVCMMFSTLFEEVFFRGFLQSRFEDHFGIIPAVVFSALCFSLYHSAQSFIGFSMPRLISLFCVGAVFSITFRITKSIITSYIVNLPQAILTFIGDPDFYEYSMNINAWSALFSAVTLTAALVLYFCFINKSGRTQISADFSV